MKKVMVFGTFDLLHKGHLNFLRQARQYGDFLVAVVAQDKTVRSIKGKASTQTQEKRIAAVENTGLADMVILGKAGDKYKLVEVVQPDVICLGYDQTSYTEGLRSALIERNIPAAIVRLRPYLKHKYKSSLLRKSHDSREHKRSNKRKAARNSKTIR